MNTVIKKKVLLVEDDPNLGMLLQEYLKHKNFEVELKRDGVEGLFAFRKNSYDIVLLDVMMPKKDGFTVAEEIRKEDKDIPIIFLTAKSLKEDKIKGLTLGADDYITKPFSIEELQLKIEIFLKRSKVYKSEKTESIFNIGLYNFDFNNLSLVSPQKSRTLTQKEADVLRYFIINKNTVIKRSAILENIWGEDDYFLGRSLDVFISRLRKYLSEDTSITLENIHGVGFRLKV